jgi:hypothetical protein
MPQNGDYVIGNMQQTFHFCGKINVPGSIYQINPMFDIYIGAFLGIPSTRNDNRCNRYARSFSCSIQSVTIIPSWTSPIL